MSIVTNTMNEDFGVDFVFLLVRCGASQCVEEPCGLSGFPRVCWACQPSDWLPAASAVQAAAVSLRPWGFNGLIFGSFKLDNKSSI